MKIRNRVLPTVHSDTQNVSTTTKDELIQFSKLQQDFKTTQRRERLVNIADKRCLQIGIVDIRRRKAKRKKNRRHCPKPTIAKS